jgi:hypothetical protein
VSERDAVPFTAHQMGLLRPRLGQGAFRVAVTDAYGRSCAVTPAAPGSR